MKPLSSSLEWLKVEMFSEQLRSRDFMNHDVSGWSVSARILSRDCCNDVWLDVAPSQFWPFGVVTLFSRSPSSNRLVSKLPSIGSRSSRCRFRSDVRRIAPRSISDFSSGGGRSEVGRCCCCCWWGGRRGCCCCEDVSARYTCVTEFNGWNLCWLWQLPSSKMSSTWNNKSKS